MNYVFTQTAYQQLMKWIQNDRKIVRKIDELVKDIQRNGPDTGIGKPEALKYLGAWSRRINHEHRLIYRMNENKDVVILSCCGHYTEKNLD